MKIPKAEDIVLNLLAILSLIFLLSGAIRIVSNGDYGFPLLSIGVVLFIIFVAIVAMLRRKR